MGAYYWLGNRNAKEYIDFESAKHGEIINNTFDCVLMANFVDRYVGYHLSSLTSNQDLIWLSDESGDWDAVDKKWKEVTHEVLLNMLDYLWDIDKYPSSLNFIFYKLNKADEVEKLKPHTSLDLLLNRWIGELKPFDESRKAKSYVRAKAKKLMGHLKSVFKDGYYIRQNKELQRYILKKLKESKVFREVWNKE
jgi:hypothetical protein